jgi:hypothetical protein
MYRIEVRDQARSFPDLDRTSVDVLLCLRYGRFIVRALYDRRRPGDVSLII